jgi:hypothetical protein
MRAFLPLTSASADPAILNDRTSVSAASIDSGRRQHDHRPILARAGWP